MKYKGSYVLSVFSTMKNLVDWATLETQSSWCLFMTGSVSDKGKKTYLGWNSLLKCFTLKKKEWLHTIHEIRVGILRGHK